MREKYKEEKTTLQHSYFPPPQIEQQNVTIREKERKKTVHKYEREADKDLIGFCFCENVRVFQSNYKNKRKKKKKSA